MAKCDSCDFYAPITSNYCPNCGEEWGSDELDFPLEVDYYIHDQANSHIVENEWGVKEETHPDLHEFMRYIGYEEKLTYRVEEDGTCTVIAVNGRTVEEAE